MTKTDFLQDIVEGALLKVSFIERCKSLSHKFNSSDDSFKWTSADVIGILKGIGYEFQYSNARGFYFEEKASEWSFKFSFDIRWNSIEFASGISNKTLGIQSTSPWGFWVELMTNEQVHVNLPCFENFNQLSDLLKDATQIFSDIRTELLRVGSK
jgi:hypothetical protein